MALAYTKKLPEPKPCYVIDFFCGCGGMSYGFANTRQSHHAFKILAGIDIDQGSLETYKANINAPVLNIDVREIEATPEILSQRVPEFDALLCRPLIFIGCAPCQGFSAHRKKDERDDVRNSLLMSFAKVCGAYRPDLVVMENVPEVLTGKFRNYFHEAAQELERLGYQLTMDVLDMSLYGVPQRRRRAIILGSLGRPICLPSPVFSKEAAITVRNAISHLNPLSSGEADLFDQNHRAPQHSERILKRIMKTPADGGDRRTLSLDEQLDCHMSLDNGNTPGFTDVYGRLRWDAPSITITAKSSTPSCGRFLHPEQHRNISAREAAILQGFPQSYLFKGSIVHQYRQIGEAVPPLFARFLAWQVLDWLCPLQQIPRHLFDRPGNAYQDSRHSTSQERVALVDCFCGAGGLSLGFEAAKYDLAFAFDNDTDCIDTFKYNISPLADIFTSRHHT